MKHTCKTCKFCKQCTEVEKRLSGKGAFCYDYEEKEAANESNNQRQNV